MNKEVKGRETWQVRQGLDHKGLVTIVISQLLCGEWIPGARVAVRKQMWRLLDEKIGANKISGLNQDTCAGKWGATIRDNRHDQDLPLTKL